MTYLIDLPRALRQLMLDYTIFCRTQRSTSEFDTIYEAQCHSKLRIPRLRSDVLLSTPTDIIGECLVDKIGLQCENEAQLVYWAYMKGWNGVQVGTLGILLLPLSIGGELTKNASIRLHYIIYN